MNWKLTAALAPAILAGIPSFFTTVEAKAEPAAGLAIVCPLTGPGVAACATVGVLLHEAVVAGNGQDAFGESGEVMRLLAAPVRIVGANIDAAGRESGVGAQILRSGLGISVRDINQYGLWGGPNSIFRKPFG